MLMDHSNILSLCHNSWAWRIKTSATNQWLVGILISTQLKMTFWSNFKLFFFYVIQIKKLNLSMKTNNYAKPKIWKNYCIRFTMICSGVLCNSHIPGRLTWCFRWFRCHVENLWCNNLLSKTSWISSKHNTKMGQMSHVRKLKFDIKTNLTWNINFDL